MFVLILLLAAGMLNLIIYAIAKKKWALLFIPLGLMLVSAFFLSLTMPSPVEVQYDAATNVDIASVPADSLEHDGGPDSPARTVEYNTNTNIKVTRHQPAETHPQPMHSLGMVTLMGLLILGGLIIFAIKQKKWSVILIPLGVAGVLVIGILLLRNADVPAPSGIATQTATQGTSVTAVAPGKPLPPVWSPGIEKDFQADVYCSKTAALRVIASRLDNMVGQMVLNGKPIPAELALITYKDKVPKELLDEATAIFQETLPNTKCFSVPNVTASLDSELLEDGKWNKYDNWISLDLIESQYSPSSYYRNGRLIDKGYLIAEDFTRGSVKASIHLKDQSVSVSPSFVTKPWLENFSAFQSSTPQRQFAIAYSQTSCNSSEWAGKQAISQAQQTVHKMIGNIYRSMPQSQRGRGGFSITNADLYNHGIIVDNFSQMFSGSRPIHRHALLLDVSPDRIQPLAQKKIRGYNQARQTWAYHIFSAIGIALAICVIYLILNAATKGYYSAVLRILTILGIILVVVLFLSIA